MLKALLIYLSLVSSTGLNLANSNYEFYSTFVPRHCCFTNDCCYPVKENDLEDLGNGQYKIKSSGQIVARTGYSPDGQYHRCSCDWNSNTGTWDKTPEAHTRCLFIPYQGT